MDRIKEELKEQMKDIKELREKTGASIVLCKSTLKKHHYMMDEAEKDIRENKVINFQM